MPLFRRRDGELVRDVPLTRRIMPFLMPTRTEAAVYFEQQLDIGPALAFVERWNATHAERITTFHLFVHAIARTLAERPRLNRFTMGGYLYQRRGIFISYSAKKAFTDDGHMVALKQQFEPEAGFAETVKRLSHTTRTGKSDERSHVDKELALFLRLPAPILSLGVRLIRWLDAWNLLPAAFTAPDPLYASVFVANLGSVKLDAAYHHNFEYGNIPVFATIGKREKAPFVREDGSLGVREQLTVRWTFDERIEDGLYCARALELLRGWIENPDTLAPELAAVEVRAS